MSLYNLRGKQQFKLFYVKFWEDLSYLINYLVGCLIFFP